MNPKRYVFYVLSLVAVGATVMAGLIALSFYLGRDSLPHQILVDHQIAKAARAPQDTIFLGDSSLGNAIDAIVWRQLSGRPALNLALTGYYGYAGSYYMLQRVLKHGRPKLVVFMHTADMVSRQPSAAAQLHARDAADLSVLEHLQGTWHAYFHFAEMRSSLHYLWSRLGGRSMTQASQFIENDYVRQGPPMAIGAQAESLDRRPINMAAVEWLRLTHRLCQDSGLTCVYLHGPLAGGVCAASLRYLDRANQAIDRAGMRRVGSGPLCMPVEQLGDSHDHVHPAFKSDYTRRYHSLLSGTGVK